MIDERTEEEDMEELASDFLPLTNQDAEWLRDKHEMSDNGEQA